MIKSENKVASYSIMCFGNVGQAQAKAFARNGIEVLMTADYIHSLNNQNIEGYNSKGSKTCEILGGVKNVCYTSHDFSKAAA